MTDVDLIIIGAGPGGYEMAARAAARGLAVTLIERDALGGTCLNRGCIPTKALCRNAEVLTTIKNAAEFGVAVDGIKANFELAASRKNAIVSSLREGVAAMLKAQGVNVVAGEARFTGNGNEVEVEGKKLTAKNVVIATGSKPAVLPIDGAELAITSNEMLELTELPHSVCVIGGGVIGMEFAGILHAYGVEVTVVEYCKEILPPFDRDVAKRLRTALSKRGINILTQSAAQAITKNDDGTLTVTVERKGKPVAVTAQAILMATGRQPVIPQGLELTGVETTKRGVVVDSNMRTTVEGIYAIGDVNGRIQLAHAATAQGDVALSHIMGEKSAVDLRIVPAAVFTAPELAMVGLTEDQCEDQGIEVVSVKALFRANGKAQAMGEADGIVKLIVSSEDQTIAGCHICGPHAADLIQEVAMAMSCKATVQQLANTIHNHPTLGEVVQQAAQQLA